MPRYCSLRVATMARRICADMLWKWALKARICRMLNWNGFPSTNAEFRAYRSFQTHDLDVLLHLSGQEDRVRQSYAGLWGRVAVWTAESRYNLIGTAQREPTAEMIQAAEQLLVLI
jgi:hypothetical protein